jgi:hypothetical protein
MKVIARNNGPWSPDKNGSLRKGLIEGKTYDVIKWSYQDHNISPGYWINRTDDFLNPREAKFYIKVINEDGIEHDYWNDYFLSSAEMRDYKLEQLGI